MSKAYPSIRNIIRIKTISPTIPNKSNAKAPKPVVVKAPIIPTIFNKDDEQNSSIYQHFSSEVSNDLFGFYTGSYSVFKVSHFNSVGFAFFKPFDNIFI